MSPPGRSSYRLPPELWRLVFWLATGSLATYDVEYVPFEPLREMRETVAYSKSLAACKKTCGLLMQVCRLWRLLAAEFLYADVRIANARALQSLMRGLERSKVDGLGGFGRHVRRLELPTLQMNATSHKAHRATPLLLPLARPVTSSIHLADIFHYTPRLEILVRPPLHLDIGVIHFWTSLIDAPLEYARRPLLPHLRRLEWHETELDTRIYGKENAARLFELISNSPALEHFFFSSDRPEVLANLAPFPSLHTLRVARAHYHSHSTKMPSSPTPVSFSSLRNLILHTALPSALLPFLAVVGHRLHSLELAFAPQVVFSPRQMQRILSRCPALSELAFYLGAPEISALPLPLASSSTSGDTGTHPALRRVRMKLSPEEWYPYKHVLRSQFAVLEGPSFPCLQEIVLHDATRSLVKRQAGPPFVRAMERRGCRTVYEDGQPVLL